MTLPNFLGIGAARSGTTWLDKVLRSHPDLYLPERRKEIHFFDQFYERGSTWYEDFFPSLKEAAQYQGIGEITPSYLYSLPAPARIQDLIPNCRFILMLRNPADRAYSHYGFLIRELNERRPFETFLDPNSEIFLRGFYAKQLKHYFQYFPQENFLILIYEEVMKNQAQALVNLADFLYIDANKFDHTVLQQRINASSYSQYPQIRLLARRFRDFLRKNDLDWVWNVAKNSGADHLFESNRPLPAFDAELRQLLISKYESDIVELERLIGIDLSTWRMESVA